MQARYISTLPSALFIEKSPRRLCILGSTGSIGQSALRVVDEQPDFFAIIALAGGKNYALLAEQALRYKPAFLAVQDDATRKLLQERLAAESGQENYHPEILVGQKGFAELVALENVDMVLSAQVGATGLFGTLAAIRAGKTVALANKECLVLAGDIIRAECTKQQHEYAAGKHSSCCAILPVDSEHNAIFQCLAGQNALGISAIPWGLVHTLTPHDASEANETQHEAAFMSTASHDAAHNNSTQHGSASHGRTSNAAAINSAAFQSGGLIVQPNPVARLILTASGGPFRNKSIAELQRMRKEDALAHPVWNMGAKISIDSSTLMNKGLEVIEACHLYGLPQNKVDVLVHPQSIIHSFVEYADNSRLAQMGVPDMRTPIAYCLGWPHRIKSGVAPLALAGTSLTFEEPDNERFPALNLCRQAFEEGKGYSVALNAANEIAVELFLQDQLTFPGITQLCKDTMASWPHSKAPQSLEEALEMDDEARHIARACAKKM